MTERIGIGVTTHNRVGMLHQCVYNIECHTPDDRVLVVVDDASDPAPYHPFKAPGQTYRFEQNVGVARAKNKCIELLMASEVDHVFLFDDDTWPVEKDWWRQYTESGYEHLSWNWLPRWDDYRDLWPLADDHGITSWNTSNGCLLYYTRKALETAGGMRVQFGRWGFEHLEHSYRIHRFGLTPEPFLSLADQRVSTPPTSIVRMRRARCPPSPVPNVASGTPVIVTSIGTGSNKNRGLCHGAPSLSRHHRRLLGPSGDASNQQWNLAAGRACRRGAHAFPRCGADQRAGDQ
ncbi:glycosyltransferase [Mycobacterium phage Capablanca]|nr:glycosyltransferase [Mycobacterium phage Capablanca]